MDEEQIWKWAMADDHYNEEIEYEEDEKKKLRKKCRSSQLYDKDRN